jgi:threonine/homoserine/homoserine lactone efflux protein
VTVPMVLAADGFSRLLRARPRITRAIDYLFASVFAAFAVRILMTQGR